MRTTGVLAVMSIGIVVACGGGASNVRPACPTGQTSLDGTCVSQQIADYVGCIRATGATVASDNSRSLSAAAGAAGVTASTEADVKDKLERRYATVSDSNAQEIIHNCYAKTAGGNATSTTTASSAANATEVVVPARSYARSEGVAIGATEWGANILTSGPPWVPKANMASYDVTLVPGKTYELWVEFTAAESRPVEMRFNGEVVTQTALASTTGSWFERDVRWFREGTVMAKTSSNVLEIRRPSAFSHIKTFKFVPMH